MIDGLRLEKTENFNLGPRLPNREYRDRDWLEPGEVEAMIQAVRRYAARTPEQSGLHTGTRPSSC